MSDDGYGCLVVLCGALLIFTFFLGLSLGLNQRPAEGPVMRAADKEFYVGSRRVYAVTPEPGVRCFYENAGNWSCVAVPVPVESP